MHIPTRHTDADEPLLWQQAFTTLPPELATFADLLMAGHSQAHIRRTLHVTRGQIEKRRCALARHLERYVRPE